MNVNRMSLVSSLLSIINENDGSDTYAVLARYFLEHYSEIDKLNIFDVATDCFVSRSSVRRFCQAIGYEHFTALKNDYRGFDDYKSFFPDYHEKTNFRNILTADIFLMIEELDRRMNTEEVDRIITSIHDAPRVVALINNSSGHAIKRLQQALVFCGKILRIIPGDYNNHKPYDELESGDYLMVVSVSGVFAESARELVEPCKAQKVLVTASRKPEFSEYFDKVYHLSTDDLSDKYSVYKTYGLSYMFDILASAYCQKYRK